MIKDQITADLKEALLNGDTQRVTVLRGLKTAVTYAEVAQGNREVGLNDDEILAVFQKEAKKRQDSIALYEQAGESDRAAAERAEKAIIDRYLPAPLGEEEVAMLVKSAISELGATDISALGKVIGAVKARAGQTADGALIARLVRAALQQ